jgi:hypothetical protein
MFRCIDYHSQYNSLTIVYCTGCNRIRYSNLKIYCDETNGNSATLLQNTCQHFKFPLSVQVSLITPHTSRQYSNSFQSFFRKVAYQSYDIISPVTKLLQSPLIWVVCVYYPSLHAI